MIRLENIKDKGFNKETGVPQIEFPMEFVCDYCRHLVSQDDTYCAQCGDELISETSIEHYFRGKYLSDEEYNEAKSMDAPTLKLHLQSLRAN